MDMGKHTVILTINIYLFICSKHVILVLLSFEKSKCALDNSKINKQNKQTLPKVETLQRDRNYYLQISSQPQPQVRQNLFNIKKD